LKIQIPNSLAAAIIFLTFGVVLGSFAYGVWVSQNEATTQKVAELREAIKIVKADLLDEDPWWYVPTKETSVVGRYDPQAVYPGLTLIATIEADDEVAVKVVDFDGTVLQQWNPDWHTMWGDATHIPPNLIPKQKLAAIVHGVVLLPNNDIVFNFDSLGMARLNACSEVVWRLPELTHHSMVQDSDGNLWASSHIYEEKPIKRFPHLKTPRTVPSILKVSPEGKVLDELRILDLLEDNGYRAYLFMGSVEPSPVVGQQDDILHLNDVEIFPQDMEPGLFEPGDILVSLRNIHSIFVADAAFEKIKYWHTGDFVRQHDPDFIDGNRISLYDNNNSAKADTSRIITIDARTDEISVRYPRNDGDRFFSRIAGKHQRLPNGNVLITESTAARAIEIAPNDVIVWEYRNIVEPGLLGMIQEATRLPAEVTAESLAASRKACGGS
jgi:hypothetical protein